MPFPHSPYLLLWKGVYSPDYNLELRNNHFARNFALELFQLYDFKRKTMWDGFTALNFRKFKFIYRCFSVNIDNIFSAFYTTDAESPLGLNILKIVIRI